MKKYLMIFFALFVGLSMISCSEDSVSIIDIGDDDDDEVSWIYSINFTVEGSSETFKFSVDMEGATIEGDDLPDDFEGDVLEFNPDIHEVFIAGSMVGWPQPGTESSLRLTRAGSNGGVVPAGNADFKFFIVIDEEPSWEYGEWEGDPNRRTEITAGGTFSSDWGDQPEVEPGDPDVPQELFMIGSSVGGWDWSEVNLPMYPVHSKDGMFWKIVWVDADIEDPGFKFAPQRDWMDDFGWDGNDPADEIYGIGGSNFVVENTGYYMVVVNWESQEVSITAPQVYLIGDTIDSWDTAAEGALFTVDNENEVVTITRELAAAELRMYAWFDKGWFTDWWQSEFIILDGEIEFRGDGDDQERVNLEADGEYTIDLNFRTNEGSIEAN